MEATYVWASIHLACSIVTYIMLISKIMFMLNVQCSGKTKLVDCLGVIVISSVQLIITSIQLSVILINSQENDWCFVNHFILYKFTQGEIYILFCCLILMTANFHQRLVNLTCQEYEGQNGTCSQPILGMGIAVVCAIGIFILAHVRKIDDCQLLHQESQQLQNYVLFMSSVVALLIINFLVCYHCFTTEHSVLTFIENWKLIPNIRRSVIGLCFQNISFVILCYPWCVIQNHSQNDSSIPFWIYCLKSIVIPLVWTVFPELIPNLAIRLCGKTYDKEDVYLTTIYRDYQSRKSRPRRVWTRSMSCIRASSECLYLNPINNVHVYDREEVLYSDPHYESMTDLHVSYKPYRYPNSGLKTLDSIPSDRVQSTSAAIHHNLTDNCGSREGRPPDSEPHYESINSLQQTDVQVHYEPYRHPSSDPKSSDSTPSNRVQSTSAGVLTDNRGGRKGRPSTLWTQQSLRQDSPTPCPRTRSKIVNGYLIPVNVYEDVI